VLARPPKPPRARPAGPRNGPLDRLARARITPNQITLIGLFLVTANSALYLWHQNPFTLGTGLMFSYLFDALDGVVARRQGTVSRFGGYLDAVIDRYQELVTFIALAWVNDWWALVFFVATGSMLTSYNKARAAMEMPVDNKSWPDLLERPQRLWIVCVALIGQNSLPWLLPGILGLLGVLTHFTALQRFVRAQRHLAALDAAESGSEDGPLAGGTA
jgi:phosphatidylglycerophosphate synthase